MSAKERTLNTEDKISIVNSLMQEDREEIRINKNILVTTTFTVVSGVVAVSAFAISHADQKNSVIYLVGVWSLFFLYIFTFLYFKRLLFSLRMCLDIREKMSGYTVTNPAV